MRLNHEIPFLLLFCVGWRLHKKEASQFSGAAAARAEEQEATYQPLLIREKENVQNNESHKRKIRV